MPPTRILSVRSHVQSFEEVRLALQRLSADVDRLSGTNPFSVTIGQAGAAEVGGGGIAGATKGQLLATNDSDAWAALQPATDAYGLVLDSGETLGVKWAPVVTAAAALIAPQLVVGDGARGLSSVGITVDGSQNIANVGSVAFRINAAGLLDHNGREVLKLGVLASAANHNYLVAWNADQAVAPRIAVAGGGSQIGIDFYDSGPNELLKLASAASAVGYLEVTNAIDGNPVLLTAQTSTTNAGMTIGTSGTGVITLDAVTAIPGLGTGGLTDYDLTVGDVTTPSYGVIRLGGSTICMGSYKVGDIDLDQTMMFRNIVGPATGPVQFAFVSAGAFSLHFAIATAAAGNHTYSSRSFVVAGPAPASTAAVTIAYWNTQGLFDHLICDTAGSGAELGVQGNVEFEKTLFVDTIAESTTDAGVTIEAVLLKDGLVDGHNVGNLLPLLNGIFIESFDALATSNGTVVTMSIEQSGGGDLTMNFSDGQTTLDCTPLGTATIPLTAGADDSPTGNFIYVPQSTKILTKSTSAWPSAEHIKIGYFSVPSATYVQANGVYVNHNTNDHAQGTDGQGHLVHVTERLRSQHAIYKSGVVLTITVGGGTTVDAAVTAGVIYQMHKHATPALNTATGDAILVINQNGAAYDPVTDLETLTNDSAGTAVKKFFNWVIWGVGNKGGEYSPLMLNLPTGSYNQQEAAEGDVSGYDVLTIPSEFSVDSQTGFLIARVTMSKVGGTWAHVSTVDLRGATPQTAVGGVGGVATEFPDNAFGIFDEGDSTKEMVFQLSGISTGNTRTITAADQNIDLTPDTGSYLANIVADTSPVLGGELDVGAFAINSSTGPVDIETGGTLVARFEETNKTLLMGLTASELARFKIHIKEVGAPVFAMFEVQSDTGSDQCGMQFRKATEGPADVNVGDRCGGLFWLQYSTGAYRNTASIRTVALTSQTCETLLSTGSNDAAITLEGTRNVTFELSGVRLFLGGGTTTYIEHDAANGLVLEVPTGKAVLFTVNDVQSLGVATTVLSLGPNGAPRGSFEYGTAGQLVMRDSGSNAAITLHANEIGFFGVAPVTQPTALTASLTDISFTTPGTPDYTMAFTNTGPFGWTTLDKARTAMSVLRNLEDRVNELETKQQALGLLA